MKKAMDIDDIDGFIESTNKITENLGGKSPINSFDEFDSLMRNEDSVKL
jgi:hypothetical protein